MRQVLDVTRSIGVISGIRADLCFADRLNPGGKLSVMS